MAILLRSSRLPPIKRPFQHPLRSCPRLILLRRVETYNYTIRFRHLTIDGCNMPSSTARTRGTEGDARRTPSIGGVGTQTKGTASSKEQTAKPAYEPAR